jgi:lysozyme family protein
MREVCEVDMSDFDRAFEIVVGVEGGFSKDPSDPGNWTGGKRGVGTLNGTKYGISAATYPHEDIETLTPSRAKALYMRDFWMAANCDEFPWPLNLVLFDGAVQHDPQDAKELLQKAVGVKADGKIGPATKAAVSRLSSMEAAVRLLRVRLEYYQSLSLFYRYGDGWKNRLFRVALAA